MRNNVIQKKYRGTLDKSDLFLYNSSCYVCNYAHIASE